MCVCVCVCVAFLIQVVPSFSVISSCHLLLGRPGPWSTMEDIDGGLHPAVDGQSLDEDENEVCVCV